MKIQYSTNSFSKTVLKFLRMVEMQGECAQRELDISYSPRLGHELFALSPLHYFQTAVAPAGPV